MKPSYIIYPLSLSLIALISSAFTSIDTISSDNPEQPQNECLITKKNRPVYEGFLLSADALFWTASESGLSYATTTSSYDRVGKGEIKDPDFRWDYGFRVGAGFHIPHGGWDTCMNYTWFQDTATGETKKNPEDLLLATLISANNIADSATYMFSARANWNLSLNILDLELGKTLIPAKWVSFRPFIGTKTAWIHQKYKVKYSGVMGPFPAQNYYVHMKNNYWGVGPRIGLNTQFWMGYGLSVFGNLAASLVYGEFNLKHEETADDLTVTDLSPHYYAGRAITDLQLGLRWDSNVCKSKKASVCKCSTAKSEKNFSITAGWEQHLFFSQGEFMSFTDCTNVGRFTQEHNDLSVQGATLSMRMDF